MRNLALEVPGLEFRDVIKRSIKKIVGSCGGCDEKSGPGGIRARNERF